MTIETLKKLIEIEFERTGTISQFKHEVFRLIDLYESDKKPISLPNVNYSPTLTLEGDGTVPYSVLCGCNPKNGGSGICGCTIGNTMVKNPHKYNTMTNFTTSI
jgi:hypothetical protein